MYAIRSYYGSSQIRMLNRQFTDITVDNSGVFIDNAQIIATDVPAANGALWFAYLYLPGGAGEHCREFRHSSVLLV